LLPGAYVQVHLKLPGQTRAVTIPSSAVLFRSAGLQVGLVRNGHAELVPITIGRDYGFAVEVISGLTPADDVILSPPDSLITGAPVHVVAQKSVPQ
jgi:multidrug efflux pump subunit AcrA (membrane-fusion protein)